MPKKRITVSLDTDVPCEKALLDFVTGLPKRTRSEILKEVWLDALEKKEEKPSPDPPPISNDLPGIDPDEVVENLF
jgi:hypothetical protein